MATSARTTTTRTRTSTRATATATQAPEPAPVEEKKLPPIPQLMNRPPLRTVYSGEFPEKKSPTQVQERYEMYVLEEQPSQKLYSFLQKPYRLWMPWTYYIMKLQPWKTDGVMPSFQRILWSPDQIRFTNEHFYSPGLPNLGQGDGIPCFGQSVSVMGEEMEKLAGQYGSIFDWAQASLWHMWWDQNANNDLFPVNNPFMQALAKGCGEPSASNYGNAPRWFEYWETLDRGQVLDMPMMPISGLTINTFFPHLLTKDKQIGLV